MRPLVHHALEKEKAGIQTPASPQAKGLMTPFHLGEALRHALQGKE